MFTQSAWITAAAAVAVITFASRTLINVWIALDKRKHLCSALRSYLNDAVEQYKKSIGSFNLEAIEKRIDEEPEYMPYAPFDPTRGFSIEVLRSDYAFLDSNAMDTIVTYLNNEGYLQAMSADLSTEYLRSLPADRKKGIIIEYRNTREEAYQNAKKALEEIKEICNRGKLAQIKNALF